MSLRLKKRVLAIDYGTKRIGLAQSDPLGLFAQPVGTFDSERLFKTLREMVAQGDIEKIIVGYPLSNTGEQNTMTGLVDRFIDSLRETFPQILIETLNEYHSSRDARQLLIASGTSKKKRAEKGRLDSAAACLLLSEYLESLSGKS
ncbi:MAG: Holliday junction resolvase RuvX [Chlorobium sp.]|nr:MAG: Holliday junction resolvase RuvX [Chlorobium sp.]